MPIAAALLFRAPANDRSVLLPRRCFAFEQHSSVVRPPKLVPIKKNSKINVPQKQQKAGAGRSGGDERGSGPSIEYP
jgi:hypothetical protein